MRNDAIDRMKSYRLEGMFTPPVVGDRKSLAGRRQPGQRERRDQLAGRWLRSRTAHRVRAGRTGVRYADFAAHASRWIHRYQVGFRTQRSAVPRGAGSWLRQRGGCSAAWSRSWTGSCSGSGGCAGRVGVDVGAVRRQPAVQRHPQAAVVDRRIAGGGIAHRETAIRRDLGSQSRQGRAITWQVPYGETPDNVRNILKAKKINFGNTGMNGSVGVVITKTLVILGDSQVTSITHPRGAMMRAYDKMTGKEVGAVLMPAPVSGSPMTYMWQDKQYIIIAISGGTYSGEYIAWALPDSE